MGSVTNTAVGSGESPSGLITVGSLPVTSFAQQTAALVLEKDVDVAAYDSVGDVLTYEIVVTNTGNLTLDEVVVVDPRPGSGSFDLDCAALPATLSPGDDGTCTATYTVTQADLDAGRVINIASVQANDPDGVPVIAPDADATATALQGYGMTVRKTVDEAGYDAVGDLLTYAVSVTNTGNVTLSEVEVTDAAPGAGAFDLDCALLPADLAPGEDGTCTATYEVTQADIDTGSVTNTAQVDATSPTGPISAASLPVISSAQQTPALAVVKTVDFDAYDSVGDVLNYAITVTNVGNVTLGAVEVTDPSPGSGLFVLDCGGLTATLGPGDEGTCAAEYTVTQADLDRGSVRNQVRVEAVDPQQQAQSAHAAVTSTADTTPGLALTKTVAEASYAAVGDVLHYTITARNVGNVTLRQVRVVDPAPGGGPFWTDCGTVTSLAPGASSVCRATYTVTASDLTSDGLTNTARASAPGQVEVLTASASSSSERPGLPGTGARDFSAMVSAGLGLLLSGLLVTGLVLGRRRRHRA